MEFLQRLEEAAALGLTKEEFLPIYMQEMEKRAAQLSSPDMQSEYEMTSSEGSGDRFEFQAWSDQASQGQDKHSSQMTAKLMQEMKTSLHQFQDTVWNQLQVISEKNAMTKEDVNNAQHEIQQMLKKMYSDMQEFYFQKQGSDFGSSRAQLAEEVKKVQGCVKKDMSEMQNDVMEELMKQTSQQNGQHLQRVQRQEELFQQQTSWFKGQLDQLSQLQQASRTEISTVLNIHQIQTLAKLNAIDVALGGQFMEQSNLKNLLLQLLKDMMDQVKENANLLHSLQEQQWNLQDVGGELNHQICGSDYEYGEPEDDMSATEADPLPGQMMTLVLQEDEDLEDLGNDDDSLVTMQSHSLNLMECTNCQMDACTLIYNFYIPDVSLFVGSGKELQGIMYSHKLECFMRGSVFFPTNTDPENVLEINFDVCHIGMAQKLPDLVRIATETKLIDQFGFSKDWVIGRESGVFCLATTRKPGWFEASTVALEYEMVLEEGYLKDDAILIQHRMTVFSSHTSPQYKLSPIHSEEKTHVHCWKENDDEDNDDDDDDDDESFFDAVDTEHNKSPNVTSSQMLSKVPPEHSANEYAQMSNEARTEDTVRLPVESLPKPSQEETARTSSEATGSSSEKAAQVSSQLPLPFGQSAKEQSVEMYQNLPIENSSSEEEPDISTNMSPTSAQDTAQKSTPGKESMEENIQILSQKRLGQSPANEITKVSLKEQPVPSTIPETAELPSESPPAQSSTDVTVKSLNIPSQQSATNEAVQFFPEISPNQPVIKETTEFSSAMPAEGVIMKGRAGLPSEIPKELSASENVVQLSSETPPTESNTGKFDIVYSVVAPDVKSLLEMSTWVEDIPRKQSTTEQSADVSAKSPRGQSVAIETAHLSSEIPQGQSSSDGDAEIYPETLQGQSPSEKTPELPSNISPNQSSPSKIADLSSEILPEHLLTDESSDVSSEVLSKQSSMEETTEAALEMHRQSFAGENAWLSLALPPKQSSTNETAEVVSEKPLEVLSSHINIDISPEVSSEQLTDDETMKTLDMDKARVMSPIPHCCHYFQLSELSSLLQSQTLLDSPDWYIQFLGHSIRGVFVSLDMDTFMICLDYLHGKCDSNLPLTSLFCCKVYLIDPGDNMEDRMIGDFQGLFDLDGETVCDWLENVMCLVEIDDFLRAQYIAQDKLLLRFDFFEM